MTVILYAKFGLVLEKQIMRKYRFLNHLKAQNHVIASVSAAIFSNLASPCERLLRAQNSNILCGLSATARETYKANRPRV